MKDVLAEELETFERNRAMLLGKGREKYALIKGQDILGIFESKMDAIHQGYERLGNVPFLVKQIREVDIPVRIMTLFG